MSTPFVISRELAAPQALVWQALTDSNHLAHWFGPKGSRMILSEMDLRVGGRYHYGLEFMGVPMWALWEFVDIAAPERLALIQCFADAEGRPTRHPMAPVWPLQTFSTTTLAPHGDKTLLTIAWVPHEATAVEEAVFDASHASMTAGWAGSFEVLASYLDTLVGGDDTSPVTAPAG